MQEIETKFNIPSKINQEVLIKKITKLLKNNNWKTVKKRKDKVNITYFDTDNLDFYNNNITLRRILRRNKETFFRYDFKKGNSKNRTEIKKESNKFLSSNELKKIFNIKHKNELLPIITILTDHYFINFKNKNTEVEMKFDLCRIFEDSYFRELEFELVNGKKQELFNISNIVKESIGLIELKEQKYNRIVNLLFK